MSATVGVLSATDSSQSTKNCIRTTIESGIYLSKVPLFVLGAGISAGRVPFIGEMASRLIGLIQAIPESDKPDGLSAQTKKTLISQGESIAAGRASRSEAAEFFSTCQIEHKVLRNVWSDFCTELALNGLPSTQGDRFHGLFRLTSDPDTAFSRKPLCGPSTAHINIASLMTVGACHVLSLNYDPLLFLAMTCLRKRVSNPANKDIAVDAAQVPRYHIISLHTEDDILAYYSSTNSEYQPSVINARGDIFYARCSNNRCPEFSKSRSLDTRYAFHQDKRPDEAFRCSSCHLNSIQFQLSFPGYETKERLLEPVLHRLRDFLGHRVSLIIPIGLSGQWDPYLLNELFDWSLSHSIPIVDVKPDTSPLTAFEAFRHRYFPSIRVGAHEDGSWYEQWTSTADQFMAELYEMIIDIGAIDLSELREATTQPWLFGENNA